MNKALTLTDQEARYKERAEHYLAQAQKILRQLASERHREARHHRSQPNIVEQVKTILYGK